MTSLAEADPYVLSLPGPDSPAILPQWIQPGNVHANARYGAAIWPLAPLIDNPGTRLFTIYWRGCPAPSSIRSNLPPGR